MAYKWTESPDHRLGWIEYFYVDEETEEVLVNVTQHGPYATWFVWQHGGGRGEFLTKAAAMKKAESLAPQKP